MGAATAASLARSLGDTNRGRMIPPVAILTPIGRDAEVAERVLRRAGVEPRICTDIESLAAAVGDDVGALLIAEEALTRPAWTALREALRRQPGWSDVSLIVLTGEGELSGSLTPALDEISANANVTLLERPVRIATLITALRSALRARLRQFDVRDHLRDREASERELRAARAEAEHANQAKGDFLAVMSHELRTPLNAIGGYAELIQLGVHGPVTDAQRTAIDRIQRSQRHLLGLITDLLNFTRIEAGQVTYDIRDVQVDDVLDSLETLVAPQLEAKQLVFSRGERCDGLAVKADPDRAQQILVNLLSNAIKFTPEHGTVALHCHSSESLVSIAVRDSGIGIAGDRIEQIFEPFVQIGRGLNAPHEGVGLGLAISRDLARAMGGDLTAKSAPNVGSTFTLTLPKA